MVEIIPKPIEKAPGGQKILFYFSTLFLIGVIASYFVLSSFQKKSQGELQNLEAMIAKGRTPEMVSLEKGILYYQRKIKDFSQIIDQHIFISKFFTLLEKKTHPKVFFSKIDLNSKDLRVNLSGETDSFFDLGQQFLILDSEPLFGSPNLSKVSISKKGKIEFELNFSPDPKIFKP